MPSVWYCGRSPVRRVVSLADWWHAQPSMAPSGQANAISRSGWRRVTDTAEEFRRASRTASHQLFSHGMDGGPGAPLNPSSTKTVGLIIISLFIYWDATAAVPRNLRVIRQSIPLHCVAAFECAQDRRTDGRRRKRTAPTFFTCWLGV